MPEAERPGVLAQALAAANAITDSYGRAWALKELVPHLPAAERTAVLSQALAAAASITTTDSGAQWLTELAPLLPADLLPQALAAAPRRPDFAVGPYAFAAVMKRANAFLMSETRFWYISGPAARLPRRV